MVGVVQGCQNALEIIAFAGYLDVFAGCKLLEKSIKTNIKKRCKIGKEKEIILQRLPLTRAFEGFFLSV